MKTFFRSLKRSPYQTMAAMLVLYFSLFLIGIILFSVTFLYGLLKFVEAQPQVTVYFQTDIEESEITAIRDELQNNPQVASVEYISKEEAYEIYKELTADNELLIEMTSANILPASLEIFATRPEYLAQIADDLRNRKGVDEVQFQEIIVDRLLTLTNAVKTSALVLCTFLIVMSTIVIIATTSFKIALKKDEIDLFQLLGASNFYITRPYLTEGVAMGIISSIFSIISLFVAILILNPQLQSYLQGIPKIDFALQGLFTITVWPLNGIFLLFLFAIIALFGIGIGIVANFLAARRYLS